jgi:hypothetical protein
MSKAVLVKERRASRLVPTAGIALATPFLVWFAIGDMSFGGPGRTGLSHEYGPYQVGPESGYILGGVAVVIAIASVAALVIRTRQGAYDKGAWTVLAALAMAGAVASAGWRVMTAGVGGANIGGGCVLLVAPMLIAGLLIWAVWVAGGGGRWSLRRTRLLTLTAVLVVPSIYVGLFALANYDAAAGFITARQYAEVHIGQTRSAVHQRLGREGADLTYILFEPATSGVLCDFYSESDGDHAYQFCFRAGVLVSKDLRKYQSGG